jgi:uncharacterized RmlC-like cupin family protein
MNESPIDTAFPATTEVVLVRPAADALTVRQLAGFVGISAESAGTHGIAMGLAVIPPGAVAEPHVHPNHETVIYLLSGRVELRWGDGLTRTTMCEAGDFVLTPAGMPHQPRNLSTTEPVYGVFARTDPREYEASVPYVARNAARGMRGNR